MGENVITTEGDAWKRHRRVTGPAFNHSTYRNVWDTVADVYADMLKQEGWLHADETPPANFNDITHKACFVFSFGSAALLTIPTYIDCAFPHRDCWFQYSDDLVRTSSRREGTPLCASHGLRSRIPYTRAQPTSKMVLLPRLPKTEEHRRSLFDVREVHVRTDHGARGAAQENPGYGRIN